MWIFLNDAMVSIVADNNKKRKAENLLLVRSRFAGDIERVWPTADVQKTPEADYMYRAFLTREAVTAALAAEVERVNYHNFKDSVPKTPEHDQRHSAYMRVWSAMVTAQRATHVPEDAEWKSFWPSAFRQ